MITIILFIFFVCIIGLVTISTVPLEIYGIERISLLFPVGSVVLTLHCWLLSIIKIQYTREVIFIPLLVYLVVFIGIYLIIKKFRLENNMRKMKYHWKVPSLSFNNILFLVIFSLVIIQLFTVMFHGMTTKVYQPDEFSHWGFQAKMIYLGSGLESFYGGDGFETGFEQYPSFVPLLAASYYFFLGEIVDSFIRVIGSLFLASLIMYLYSKINKILNRRLISLLLIGILTTSGYVIFEMSIGLYADIEYTFFYCISSLLLISYLNNNNNTTLLVASAAFMAITAWTKTDAQYMVIFHSVIILLFNFKLSTLKKCIKLIIIYFFVASSIPILWKIYTVNRGFPASRWTINPSFNYFFDLITSSINQTFNTDNWGFLWILFLGFFLINIYHGFTRLNLIILSVVFANVIFLYASYLFMFGHEASNAASFSRYIIRIAPISLFYIASVLREVLKTKFKGEHDENISNYSGI